MSTAPRRLWLVRHGETEGRSSIRFHGSGDVLLSAEGRAQMRALAPLLRGLAPALVVHSPLLRAVESASILLAESGLCAGRVVADERLREISFGDCEGMTAAEIEAAHPEFWALHRAGTADAFPGGESRAAFRARVGAAIGELAAGRDGEDVLVVAHRGIVRTALRQLLAVPEAAGDPFAVRLGSLSVLRREPGGRYELEVYDCVGDCSGEGGQG